MTKATPEGSCNGFVNQLYHHHPYRVHSILVNLTVTTPVRFMPS